jgi:hypothetical protein
VSAADHIPSGAVTLEKIIIEQIPREEWCALSIIERGRKQFNVPTSAVKIVVRGKDGSVIADVWTRDQALTYFLGVAELLRDG